MDWQETLIKLYFFVCDEFRLELCLYNQRFMKNAGALELKFTDEEALTLYLFGHIQGHKEVLSIHKYCQDHLMDWFPNLPSYQKFNERLNRMNDLLAHLVVRLCHRFPVPEHLLLGERLDAVLDSMPIMMARGSRADSAKVAKEVADKGYCSTKKIWFHGLKLHLLGICDPGTLPIPCQIIATEASTHDNTAFKEEMAASLSHLRVFADRAYHDEGAAPDLLNNYNVLVCPVLKRKKGQKNLFFDQKLQNTAVSTIRQPIESFFNWLEVHSGIQRASKVRSTSGLYKHLWGKVAAAIIGTLIFF